MAIGIDTRTPGNQTAAVKGNGVTSVTWSHVMGSVSNGILLASVTGDNGNLTSVTWDSGGANTAMTNKGRASQGTTRAEIWYLINPASGTKSIQASGASSHFIAGSVSYSGVEQTTIFNASSPQTATGASGTNPSLSVTSANGEMVVDCVVQDLLGFGSAPTKGASQNYIWSDAGNPANSIEGGGSDQASTGASVTMSWTLSASNGAWAQAAVSLMAATGAYTLNATPGSYALVGVTTSPVADRLLPASPGSYVIAGVDAALLVGRVLSVNAGVYAISGVDASLLAQRVISSDAGVYVINGVAATLVVASGTSYVLVADTGAYTLLGQSASLLADRVVTALPGIYTLTGIDAATLVARSLVLAPGAYLITGNDQSYLINRVLQANPGAYAVNGVDAQLDYSGQTAVVVFIPRRRRRNV